MNRSVIAATTCLALAGCASPSASLVGTWQGRGPAADAPFSFGESEADFEDMVRINVNRISWIAQVSGIWLVVLASAVHYSDRLRAGVDVVGISNFVTFLENTEDYRRDFRRLEYGDERDPEMRAFLESISPLNNVDRIDIPLLVVQGRNDPRVPASESEQIVAALRRQGQPVWYIEALNEGHGYERKENRDIYEQAKVLFLQRYLLD